MSHRSSHTHCQAPQAQAQTEACQRVCLSQPTGRISKFFSPSFKKKLEHASTRASQTEKKMKRMTSLI